ncbi:hypothetical protein SORBI_3008G022701 [Sorghum bicolor]|uniref:Pentacotripeptide-repeat region of PRORP domain-containing protein n=1 Tax=Sorghum bicolor TaxID=4558 RepID=A0A1B6PB74_SORBI|nr:hypothetical protein SORBI_3008G022701 [Sorghum bicolor]
MLSLPLRRRHLLLRLCARRNPTFLRLSIAASAAALSTAPTVASAAAATPISDRLRVLRSLHAVAPDHLLSHPLPSSAHVCLAAHLAARARLFAHSRRLLSRLLGAGHRPHLAASLVDLLHRAALALGPRRSALPSVVDTLLSLLADHGLLDDAVRALARVRQLRVPPNTRTCNHILLRLARNRQGGLVRRLFDLLPVPNVFTFNIVIDFLCKEGELVEARALFVRMKAMGCSPDVVTYNSLIDGYGKCGDLEEVEQLVSEMRKSGCAADVVTYNALINCFSKFGRMEKAYSYFGEMKRQGVVANVVTFSTFVDAFCKEGLVQEAMKLFAQMRVRGMMPNEFTYTSLVDGTCKAGRLDDAIVLLDEMVHQGLVPNVVTYTVMVDGLCKEGKVAEADNVLSLMERGGVKANELLYTTLIHGHFMNNNIVYTSLIDGYMKQANLQDAFALKTKMIESGLQLDLYCYTCFISGFCNMNMMQEARGELSVLGAHGKQHLENGSAMNTSCSRYQLKDMSWRSKDPAVNGKENHGQEAVHEENTKSCDHKYGSYCLCFAEKLEKMEHTIERAESCEVGFPNVEWKLRQLVAT